MSTNLEPGSRITIQASMIEFTQGGDTIWVHGPKGNTVLRIKVDGIRGCKVTAEACPTSPVSHADLLVHDSVKVCIGREELAELAR